ncbi:MAG: 23S rRNA (uracil(1939)-C(5))-methyltransferase RlmD [Elusimicrobia bacterium]|nr:23S rRNA (uracil(1939)-C(5))-methyltransferase RlmD [Elusimicrobiota bacterium]
MSDPGAPAPATPSATPRCRHFGECGGCASQDVPYEAQLRAKEARVAAALASVGIAFPAGVRPSPQLWHYRNKMEHAFGDVYPPQENGPWLRLGFKARQRWNKVVDLEECHLLSPETAPLLASVREWARREALPPYNSVRRTGFLRYLVLREAKNGPDRMVTLVTSAGAIRKDSFLDAVRPYPASTVLWGVNAKISDVALCDEREVLSGPGTITEVLRLPGRTLAFRISPQSFFQTNTRAAELLYGAVREWVRAVAPAAALDLYCGGGGIGLSIADCCGSVTGVESNPLGVADAVANAGLNGVANARFVQGLAEDVMPSLPPAEVVVVDPPRPGLHPRLLKAVLAAPAPFLIYVSCNPEALGRDLKALLEVYAFVQGEAFDLFPHTPHVETAVMLRRR